MREFIRSVIVQDVTPAADGTYTYDLPVNALSHINLTIKCLNVTDEATIAQTLALVTDIKVLHRGTSIFQMSAADLYAYNHVMLRRQPIALNMIATDNATRAITLIIPFGRKLLDPDEAFPQTKAGNLQLQLTVDIATSDADGLILQVETTEIADANPTHYLKATTLTHTPAATGASDVDLPIGNTLLGLLIFSTTVPATTAWTTTVDKLKLLSDNTETHFSETNWESLHGDLIARCGDYPGHTTARGDDSIAHYAYADMDVNDDGQYALDTKGLAALKARITAGDTNALRIIPVELVAA